MRSTEPLQHGTDRRCEIKQKSDVEEKMMDMQKQGIPGGRHMSRHVMVFGPNPEPDEDTLQRQTPEPDRRTE